MYQCSMAINKSIVTFISCYLYFNKIVFDFPVCRLQINRAFVRNCTWDWQIGESPLNCYFEGCSSIFFSVDQIWPANWQILEVKKHSLQSSRTEVLKGFLLAEGKLNIIGNLRQDVLLDMSAQKFYWRLALKICLKPIKISQPKKTRNTYFVWGNLLLLY